VVAIIKTGNPVERRASLPVRPNRRERSLSCRLPEMSSDQPEPVRRVDLAGRDGLRLAADVAGDPSNPAVLLLHGGGQTRHSWGTTLVDLARRGWYVASIDQRGHGDSEWAPDGDYTLDAFAGDIRCVAAQFDRPALVGASLGGSSALCALGETADDPCGRALVLVDVAPHIEAAGADRIGAFMREHLEDGFGSLDEVADAIQGYNPHRPRPTNMDGLRKNVRRRDDGRWVWHWDPAFITGRLGSEDEPRTVRRSLHDGTLVEAAKTLTVPVLLVRGRMSDLLSEAGAQKFLELVPHAEFVDVAGAGHMVAGDRNDSFNTAIVTFLDRVRPATT
jgi:pimeloyl-ACP methyl ester carboxylesterase